MPNKTCKELPVAFKNLQTLSVRNRGFLYPASTGLVAILTCGISVTLVTQCNTHPAGIHTCHHSNPRVSPLDCAHAPSQYHNNQPVGWCTCHYNNASASLAMHIYDHSTQPAGLCTSMITALQHSANWTLHVCHHSSTRTFQQSLHICTYLPPTTLLVPLLQPFLHFHLKKTNTTMVR